MTETVSVYVNVHDNGSLSISVDVPVDLIQKVKAGDLGCDGDQTVETLAKSWLSPADYDEL